MCVEGPVADAFAEEVDVVVRAVDGVGEALLVAAAALLVEAAEADIVVER